MPIARCVPILAAAVLAATAPAAGEINPQEPRPTPEGRYYQTVIVLPPGPSAEESAAKVRSEVLALLGRQSAAWSRGDIDAFCAAYAEDALFLSPSGVTRGRQAVLDRYKKRYPDRAAMGTLTLEPLESRVSAGTESAVVSVAATWTLAYPDKPSLSGLTLIVFHRTDDGWRIVQDASM